MEKRTYSEFIKSKEIEAINAGIEFDESELNKNLMPFQRDIVAWALRKGRAAIFSDCGTGKTIMQISFADLICRHTGGRALVLCPLSVAEQTKKEGLKFGIESRICRQQADVGDGINIANYEILSHFDAAAFNCVVLDESSILKSFTSSTRNELIDTFARTPYRLCCSATPAPNDFSELGNTVEFLGIMSRTEMLATYFVHDGGKTSDWRLKKAGGSKFWEWFATWAIYFNSPKDLGYEDEGYELPPLNIETILTKSEVEDYQMFVKVAETLQERREARKESMEDRTDKAYELTQSDPSQWLLWVDYNDESEILRRKIPDCVEIKGSDDPETKAQASIDFADGGIRCLVSKPSIFGFGSNFQSCHNEIFCGLSDSYERFYQAVRRCWRFGQKEPVNVYIILSEKEVSILENVRRKQALMDEMQKNMTALMKEVTLSEIKHTTRITTDYKPTEQFTLPAFMKG